MRRQLAESLPDLERTVELLAGLDWPDFSRNAECLALHDHDGYPQFGDTLISSAGLQVPATHYNEMIREYVVGHSTAKHASINDGS